MSEAIEKLEQDWLRLEREVDAAKSRLTATNDDDRVTGIASEKAEELYANAEAAAKDAYDRLWAAYSTKSELNA